MNLSESHSRILTAITEMYYDNNTTVNRLLDQNQQIIELLTQMTNLNVPSFRSTNRSLRNRNPRPARTSLSPERPSQRATTARQPSGSSNVQFFRSYLGTDNRWHNEPLDTNTQTGSTFQNLVQSLLQQNLEPVVVRPTLAQVTRGTLNHTYSNIQNPIDERCSICLSNFNPNDTVVEIHCCHHLFHSGCLLRHFDSGVRCPMCRHDIREPVQRSSSSGEENTQNTLFVDPNGSIMSNLDASGNLDPGESNLDASGNFISNNTASNNSDSESESSAELDSSGNTIRTANEILTDMILHPSSNIGDINNNLQELIRTMTNNTNSTIPDRYAEAATDFLRNMVSNPSMTNDEALQHVENFLDVLSTSSDTTPSSNATPSSNTTGTSPSNTTLPSNTNTTSLLNTDSRRITTRASRSEVENLVYDFLVANGAHQSPTIPTMTSIMSFPGYGTFMRQLVLTPQILQAASSNNSNAITEIITSALRNVIATISYERIMNTMIS